MAVERGKNHELVGSMVGAVYVHVLRTLYTCEKKEAEHRFVTQQHGRIDRSGISRGGGCSLIVVRMFHIFATDRASIE